MNKKNKKIDFEKFEDGFLKQMMQAIDNFARDEKGNCNCEEWHIKADLLLLDVLRREGYEELCDWFEKHEKSYS